MSTANRVIKNTGWLCGKTFITMFVSLYTTRLILNSLGASDFGIFNIVGGAIAMLGFLNAAMAGATQRFMSYAEGTGDKQQITTIFNVAIVLHFLIAVVVIGVLYAGGILFFNGILSIPPERTHAAIVVCGGLIVSTALTVMNAPYDAVMNAHENMRYYAIVGIIESCLKLAIAWYCMYTSNDKLIVYRALMACIPLITLTIMKCYCHSHYEECKIGLRQFWDKGVFKEMVAFAGWNLLGNASRLISSQGINIIVNIFFGTIVNAAQAIATQISGQLGVIGTALLKSVSPIVVKSVGANDTGLMERTTIMSTKVIFFVVSLPFIPIIIETQFILNLWLITPPQYASLFCKLLFIENRLADLVLLLPVCIGAFGKIKGYNLTTSFISLAPIIVSYFLFYKGFEVYVVYLLMIVSRICSDVVNIYFTHKYCHISWKTYLVNVNFRLSTAFILTIIIASTLTTFIQMSWVRLILVIVTTTVVYAAFQWFIGFTFGERRMVLEVVKRNANKLRSLFHL